MTTVAFRQYATDRYTEAASVPAGIAAGLTDRCAECGADLTAEPAEPIPAAALFVYPADTDWMYPGPDVYACPACLDCTPKLAARLAASLARSATD